MNKKELVKYWKSEEERSFLGWDFSSIEDRSEEEGLPWSYVEIVKSYLSNQVELLDMGTGGGELLLTLGHPYRKTCVTEGYEPNYQLCLNELSPKGITVKKVVNDSSIPYETERFDVIINKHESFDLNEVKRLLKPNGMFITQQVGHKDIVELSRKVLGNQTYSNDDFDQLDQHLEKAQKLNFDIIDSKEAFQEIKFFDVGALVFFAKIISWQFPDFSVDNNLNELLKIHQCIENNGYISARQHRYIMILRKN